MNRIGVVFCVLLAFFLAAARAQAAGKAAPPDAPRDARGLLERIRRAYADQPSITTSFTQSYAPAGFAETSPETGRMTLQAPAQIRFEYDGADGKLFTFDGKAARQYVAADKQLILKSLTPSERARLPLLFFDAPESVLERYDAAWKAGANGFSELVLTPKVPEGGPKSLTITAAASGDVKRLVVVDEGDNRTTFTFTQRTVGTRRPASDFALVPPAGTKIVTD
ncbi:MAG: outer membrane lipoprotein carrier protein LolA [Thermoanaerobaculia bacterium]